MARGRRHLGRLLAAALTVALLVLPVPAYADRSDEWRARAEAAITAFVAQDDGQQTAFAYAYVTQAIAWLYGWNDPRAATYLDKVYSLRNPDGGWGLGYAWDFGGDSTVNPANTTYSVTLAGHVGPMLLEAYRAGKVPREDVKKVVDLLMSTPRVTAYGTTTGQCVAYSRSGNDSAFCVHNVNAGVGWFLTKANQAGVGATGLNKLVVDIVRREVAYYIPATMWWKYKDTASGNDADHNSYSGETMYDLVPQLGGEVAWNHMANAFNDNANAPVAHVRLASLAARPGHMHPSGATWWCVLGDQWMGEFDTWMTNASLGRLAQGGYYAAKAALAC